MKKTIAACAAAILTLGTLAGCSAGTFTSDLLEDENGYKITAENADAGTSAGALGGFEVKEGEVVVLSPNLEKGKINIRLTTDKDDEAALDETVDGRVLSTYEVEPGTYSYGATVKEKATGTMVVTTVDKDEIDQQSKEFEKELQKKLSEAKGLSESKK